MMHSAENLPVERDGYRETALQAREDRKSRPHINGSVGLPDCSVP